MVSASTRIAVGGTLITLLVACSTVDKHYPDSTSSASVGSSGSSGTGIGSYNGLRNTDAGSPAVPNEGRNLDDGR